MEVRFELPDTGEAAVLTLGSFDGVHRGHAKLLSATVERARECNAKSVCISFDPHPRCVVDPANAPAMLSTVEEKIQLVSALGIDELVILPFTRYLSEMSAESFATQLIRAYSVAALVAGPTFSIGHKGAGDMKFMRAFGAQHGFAVIEVEPVDAEGLVSSQRIRNSVRAKDMRGAAGLLGRWYSVTATVERGDGRGRDLGIPTANLKLPANKLLPPPGIYAGRVMVQRSWHPAAISLGFRPTYAGTSLKLEAAIIDFEADIYGAEIELAWIEWLRAEERFDSSESLIAQMQTDLKRAREILEGEVAWSGN